MRIDKYLVQEYPRYSRRQVQKLITGGKVQVFGKTVDPDFDYEPGMGLEVELPQEESTSVQAQDIGLTSVFENDDFLVVDKPAGLVVHPGAGHKAGTVVNALLFHLGKKESSNERLGIVHRLDKDTSGLLILAKNEKTENELKRLFADREVKKEYLALVSGRVEPSAGEIDRPLGRKAGGGLKFTIGAGGRSALTRYFTQKTYPKHTLLRVLPFTGRTHQIRVHLKSIGHPVVGDTMYGGEKAKRLFLHATRLSFRLNGRDYNFDCPLPNDLKNILQRLR